LPRPDGLAAPSGFVGVVLAAQRAGIIDPLAAEAGISHKCLVPIAGRPLIAHVVAALLATPGLGRLRIVVEPDCVAAIEAILPPAPAGHDIAIDYIAAAANLADSVHAACHDLDQPIVVTTADNVLLTPGAVAAMVEAIVGNGAGGADAALAMARKATVLAAHPEGQRRFYRFSDNEYSNCNLYAFAGRRAISAAESFRSGGQFAKKPLRLLAAIGPINLALLLLHRLSLAGALGRMSRKFRLQIVPVVLADGTHAIDVDNRRTYDAAATLLARRPACPGGVAAPAPRAKLSA
jgi:GTP:adenosylcobinamide-phosphate guanylyltransferase